MLENLMRLSRHRPVLPISTERLLLRAFRSSDAERFALLAGDMAVAGMTSDIPSPLTPRLAAQWLQPARRELRCAIELGGLLVGSAGYFVRPSNVAELGFWLGRPWWGNGYVTEAARAVLRQGLADPDIAAFSASHFVDNPASQRVLGKLGFVTIGHAPQWCEARGRNVDAVACRLDRARAAALGFDMPRMGDGRRGGWRRLAALVGGAGGA
jgi:RimJ/RimL family protein N-acetyltransferase